MFPPALGMGGLVDGGLVRVRVSEGETTRLLPGRQSCAVMMTHRGGILGGLNAGLFIRMYIRMQAIFGGSPLRGWERKEEAG